MIYSYYIPWYYFTIKESLTCTVPYLKTALKIKDHSSCYANSQLKTPQLWTPIQFVLYL